jgi:LmbE family N-acetylglucosaminyl deacetylase
MKDSYNKIFNNKSRILVVLAHPDDAEIICGGTIARLIADGKQVRTVIATNGDKGMHEDISYTLEQFKEIRLSSQKHAGHELGLNDNDIVNLGVSDGQIENTYENIGKIVCQLREFQPELIITHNPTDIINEFSKEICWVNHRDHRITAQLTVDAAYPYCRDVGFFPEQIKVGLKSCYMN